MLLFEASFSEKIRGRGWSFDIGEHHFDGISLLPRDGICELIAHFCFIYMQCIKQVYSIHLTNNERPVKGSA